MPVRCSTGGTGAPAQRLDTGGQLGERKRLGEVVIGAQAEPGDPLGDRARCGEHQDPRVSAGVDQGGADLVAGHDWQIAVQHHDVVVVDRQALKCLVTVVGHVHRHRLPPQPIGDGVREQPLILNHQHAHHPIMPGRRVRRALANT
jgi:hypothetical protein